MPGSLSASPSGLPSSYRRLLIVGAGGFGREVWNWARDAWGAAGPELVGFLDADPSKGGYAPVLGDPASFVPMPEDGLLLAIGIPRVRRRVAETLLARGGRFVTLVHPTAIIAPSAVLGAGSIVCPYGIVSDAAVTGACVLVNYHASLAHDASAGEYAVFSPYATLAGDAHIGADTFLGLHAAVGPGRRLGDRCKVSANSAALADAPADSIIYGVPGRIGRLIE